MKICRLSDKADPTVIGQKNTMSTGTQCSSLTDNIPFREAVGLTPVLQQQCAVETAVDNDKESYIEGCDEVPNFDLYS